MTKLDRRDPTGREEDLTMTEDSKKTVDNVAQIDDQRINAGTVALMMR